MFLIEKLLFPFFLDKDEGGGQPDKKEAGQGAGEQSGSELPPESGDKELPAEVRDLIKKLRGTEKEFNKLKAAEDKRTRESLTETERLKAEKSDLEKRMTEVQSKAIQKLARASVIEAAAKSDFKDPSDAWALVRDELTPGEDGELEGLDKALAKLAKDKPYLLKGAGGGNGATTPPPVKPPSPGNPGSVPKWTADDLKKMTSQEFAQRWSDPEFQKARVEALKDT